MTSKYTECGYICYRSKLNSGFHFSPNQVFLWLVEQGENFTKDQINFLSVQKTGNNNILRNGKKTNFRLTYRFCKVSKSSNVNRTFFVLDVTIKIKWTQHCTNSQGKNWQCKNKTEAITQPSFPPGKVLFRLASEGAWLHFTSKFWT